MKWLDITKDEYFLNESLDLEDKNSEQKLFREAVIHMPNTAKQMLDKFVLPGNNDDIKIQTSFFMGDKVKLGNREEEASQSGAPSTIVIQETRNETSAPISATAPPSTLDGCSTMPATVPPSPPEGTSTAPATAPPHQPEGTSTSTTVTTPLLNQQAISTASNSTASKTSCSPFKSLANALAKLESRKKNHPMMQISLNRRRELMDHPVFLLCLRAKWIKSLYVYILSIIFQVIYVATFTAHMVNDHDSFDALRNKTNSRDVAVNVTEQYESENLTFGVVNGTEPYQNENVNSTYGAVLLLSSLGLIFQSMIVLLEWFSLPSVLSRVESLMVWLYKCVMYGLAFFAATKYSTKSFYQWNAGCVVMFASWATLLWTLQNSFLFGIYFVMAFRIMQTFVKALCGLFWYILAFGFLFYCLCNNMYFFQTVWEAVLKTSMMALGNKGYHRIVYSDVHSDDYDMQFHFTSLTQFVFICFLVMSLVVSNLLTSLAIHDVNAIRQDAVYTMMDKQLDYALWVELTLDILSNCNKKLSGIYGEHKFKKQKFEPKDETCLWQVYHWVLRSFLGNFYLQDIENNLRQLVIEREKQVPSIESATSEPPLDALEDYLQNYDARNRHCQEEPDYSDPRNQRLLEQRLQRLQEQEI